MVEARRSFDSVAGVYHAVRPSYPPVLFDALFEELPAAPHVVEMGAGTGLATRDLITRGATVHAIETGPSMAARMGEYLEGAVESGQLRIDVADFETANIPRASADAVFAATAYHWVPGRAQTDRPAELLRPDGVVAIIDLIQVDSPDDNGFFGAAQPIYDQYGQSHAGPPAPRRNDVDPPIRGRLAADDRFDGVAVLHADWNQTYSAAEYRQLMTSYSATQTMEPDARERLLDDIEGLVRNGFDGEVTRPLVVTLTMAKYRPGDRPSER